MKDNAEGAGPLKQESFRVQRMYDRWAQCYEDEFTEKYYYAAPLEVFNAVAQGIDIRKRDFHVLDVGVGTGLLSAHFRKASWNAALIGVDISEEMLLKCEEKGIMNFLGQVDFQINGLPFKDSSFDAVVSSGVFELLRKPDLVIEEMARVTKPGGIVAFTSVLNPKDTQGNFHEAFKTAPVSTLMLEDGIAHERAILVQALKKGCAPLACEKIFTAYRRGRSDTIYTLYTGRKLP